MELSQIHPQPLSEQIRDMLRDRIIAGDIAPGERLTETELASRLAVSRGPLREAFLTYVAPVHYNVLEPRAAADAKPKADDANAETDSDATREADDAKADDAKPKADGVKAEANSDARTERPPVPGLGVPRW